MVSGWGKRKVFTDALDGPVAKVSGPLPSTLSPARGTICVGRLLSARGRTVDPAGFAPLLNHVVQFGL